MRSGDINAALEANRNCMDLCVPLFAENPTNIKDRARVAISYQMDGEYRALAGDVAGALESFRKKLQLDEQNLNDDPANAQARRDIAYSWSRIGELLAAKRDYSEALSQERKALEFCEKLSADSPRDVHMRYRTAIVGGLMAELYAELGNREQALVASGGQCSFRVAWASLSSSRRCPGGSRRFKESKREPRTGTLACRARPLPAQPRNLAGHATARHSHGRQRAEIGQNRPGNCQM